MPFLNLCFNSVQNNTTLKHRTYQGHNVNSFNSVQNNTTLKPIQHLHYIHLQF